MGIDWEGIAKQVGGLDQDGNERVAGTHGGRRALEILLGDENLCQAVDYWIAERSGYFTVEMVLKIIRSKIAMERCYQIYKTEIGTNKANSAIFLLSCFADTEALPWINDFLDDNDKIIRLNSLMVLRNILFGHLWDHEIVIVKELLDKADGDSDSEVRTRSAEIRRQFANHEAMQ